MLSFLQRRAFISAQQLDLSRFSVAGKLYLCRPTLLVQPGMVLRGSTSAGIHAVLQNASNVSTDPTENLIRSRGAAHACLWLSLWQKVSALECQGKAAESEFRPVQMNLTVEFAFAPAKGWERGWRTGMRSGGIIPTPSSPNPNKLCPLSCPKTARTDRPCKYRPPVLAL